MITNVNGTARHILLAAHQNQQQVYSSSKTYAELLALDLIEPTQGYQSPLTEKGHQTAEFILSKKTVEDRLWQRLLSAVGTLPKGHSGNRRSGGNFFHTDNGSSTGRCAYTTWNEDGTSTHYEIVASWVGEELTCDITVREDTADDRFGPGGEMDRDTKAAARRIIVGHTVYTIEPETDAPGYCKGFGGRRWDIVFLDGRRVTTTNLWHGSTVPPKWRERWPDTARFDFTWQKERNQAFQKLLEGPQ